jgi:hypothetical protein
LLDVIPIREWRPLADRRKAREARP